MVDYVGDDFVVAVVVVVVGSHDVLLPESPFLGRHLIVEFFDSFWHPNIPNQLHPLVDDHPVVVDVSVFDEYG